MGKYVTKYNIRCDRVTLGHMRAWERSAQTRMIVYK